MVSIGTKTEAKVEVSKFSTASQGADGNIEGLDINNSAAGLIVLIGLIILTDLIVAEKIVTEVTTVLPDRKVIVTAICFLLNVCQVISELINAI